MAHFFPYMFESNVGERDRDERNNQYMTLCSLQYSSGSQYFFLHCACALYPIPPQLYPVTEESWPTRRSCRKSVLDDDGECLIVRRSVRLKVTYTQLQMYIFKVSHKSLYVYGIRAFTVSRVKWKGKHFLIRTRIKMSKSVQNPW